MHSCGAKSAVKVPHGNNEESNQARGEEANKKMEMSASGLALEDRIPVEVEVRIWRLNNLCFTTRRSDAGSSAGYGRFLGVCERGGRNQGQKPYELTCSTALC